MTREEAAGTEEAHLWETPAHWPRNVREIPSDQYLLWGEDPRTGDVYWNGNPVVLERRLANFERWLAVSGVGFTALAAIAACVQAWAALQSITLLPHS